MKNIGCNSEFEAERARDLLRAYFEQLHACERVDMSAVFHAVANAPASRFWVSNSRACIVVNAIRRGESIAHMRPNKQLMFREIHRRAIALQQRRPSLSIQQAVAEVISQPAPCFYISPGHARIIILRARKLWFQQKRTKL